MSTQTLASSHHAARRQLAKKLESEGQRLWRQIGGEFGAWVASIPRLLVLLTAAQLAAAGRADTYVGSVLGDEAAGRVNPRALAGLASDGRPLASLLQQPVVASRVALARGATVTRARAVGEANLRMILQTQVADAGRVADGVAITARPGAGYVRMLVPPGDCSRCVVLAGTFYRWNAGFQRHPKCNCSHIPAREADADDLRLDPRAYFDSLSREEQDRVFTKDGAQAIRDGADISQVVNARRGMTTTASGRLTRSDLFGQQLILTSEGITRRGVAGRALGKGRRKHGRLMPESIYELARSRDEAIRLLRLNGYLI